MIDLIKKELLHYYIEKEKLTNSKNCKDKVRLDIVNLMIKRINFILKVSKYEDIRKIIIFERELLSKNFHKNLDTINQLYLLKWLEYSKFLDKIERVNITC